MFTFVYPETGERFSRAKEMEFDTAQQGIEYWKDRRAPWEEIKVQNPLDKAAFISQSTGHIVVLREIASVGK
jgi:hypothetical protein